MKNYTMAELTEIFDKLAPASCACDWDNPGLITGRSDKVIKKIFVALDATESVIDEAIRFGADLLLTHHPMIFKPVAKVNDSTSTGRKLMKLIRADMCCFAMHTNFDSAPGCMADIVCEIMGVKKTAPLERIKGQDDSFGIGFVGELPREMYPNELAEHVKKCFNLPFVLYYAGDGADGSACGKGLPFEKKIRTVAVCPGSGRGMMAEAEASGAEAFITGDMGHHDGIDAVDDGIALIDAGHYGLERVFVSFMSDYIMKNELAEETAAEGSLFPAQAVIDSEYAKGGFSAYRKKSAEEKREPLGRGFRTI